MDLGEPEAFWRQTPRLLRLAFKGAGKRLERDTHAQRYLAWHSLRPHFGKNFPSLEEFLGIKSAKTAKQVGLDIDTSMRKWVAVMTSVSDQQAKRSRPPKS